MPAVKPSAPFEPVVCQYWKEHGIDSHRPMPVTDVITHTVIDWFRDVPRLGVVKERRIQHVHTQPRNPEQNGKAELWLQSLG
jgi:hypothetical protein